MMEENFLKKYKIKAKKSLGQNFLVNKDIVNQIAGKLNIEGNNIIEVGPGYGALTEKLLEKCPKTLTLIELDSDMVKILEDRIKNDDLKIGKTKFEIKKSDILKYQPELNKYFVIANIPYYITSPILKHFLYDIENRPEKMLILMQKDVGDKIIKGQLKQEDITKKNKNRTSVLSLFIAKKAFVKEVLFVGKQNFVPIPKVESSVLLFESHNLYNDLDDGEFFNFIKKGFCEPRKKLIKNLLKNGLDKNKLQKIYELLGLGENTRAEELTLEKWINFVKEYKKV